MEKERMSVERRSWILAPLCALLALSPAGAEVPEPGAREQEWSLAAAGRHFDARRYEQAMAAFESAAHESEVPLPPEALRRWGIAAGETGWHLTAVVRLRQYLERVGDAPDREALEARLVRSREALLTLVPRRSRVIVALERRPDWESPGERHVVRLVARDGRVTVEGLSGARSPAWERAGEVAAAVYVGLVRRLLETPAFAEDIPTQTFDPNAPGPRRSATLRLIVADEDRSLQALRGAPYDRLVEAATPVLDFARFAPLARESR
jgi:hypothetical protein